MATRTFLTPEDFKHADEVLFPPLLDATGEFLEGQSFPAQDFSSWLSLNVEARLRQNPLWRQVHPVAIGSWGRNELSPLSDLDVLFCGDEASVRQFVDDCAQSGLELKYRYHKDPADWRVGTPTFELNALFWSKPFTKEASLALQAQKKIIFSDRKNFRKTLLKEFIEERKKRNLRHDSIANYLEPNLKFGPGGLRDIQQALMIHFWYPEKMAGQSQLVNLLQQLKSFLITIRHKLHLLGYQDVLAAPSQHELAQWLGFKSHAEFMRQVQKVLARVSFYCDLIFEIAEKPEKYTLQNKDFSTAHQIFKTMAQKPTLFDQFNVLHNISSLDLSYHRDWKKVFHPEMQEEVLLALFRSQLIEKVLPEFAKIVGVVQHDHYHRFTVDAHIFQAIRRVLRVKKKANLLGSLSLYTKKMTSFDWEILLWTALYHDLGKARQKDHSLEGKMLVEKDFAKFSLSKNLQTEVAWMVENHLVLSTSAFRKDPHSPVVWKELFDKGIYGDRLRRLAVFTAMDIYATNPEAWTDWKEKLLFKLVQSLETPQGNHFIELQGLFQKKKWDAEFLQTLDQGLIASIPAKDLASDFKKIAKPQEVESVVCFRQKKDVLWIRFHSAKDQKGLFLKYVSKLWKAGATIHHAYIHTHEKYGVYDWFEVKSNKKPALLQKILAMDVEAVELKEQAKLSEVVLISETDKEWVFSFRGADKKGVLISAAGALFDLGLQVRWAKIHTWGRQVDDVFGVVPMPGRAVSDWTQELQKRLVENF